MEARDEGQGRHEQAGAHHRPAALARTVAGVTRAELRPAAGVSFARTD
jgi:hypothetical protein